MRHCNVNSSRVSNKINTIRVSQNKRMDFKFFRVILINLDNGKYIVVIY